MFPCKISLPPTLGFSKHALKKLMELWENRFLCDAELVAIDGGVVPAHLEVVRAFTDKFKFDVSTAHLHTLVSLMYGANVILYDLAEALELCQAAISAELLSVMKELIDLLEKHAESEASLPFSLWSFARSHRLPKLEKLESACLQAAALQFSTLWRQSSRDLVALPVSDLLQLLSHPFLVTAAEEEVCDLIAAKCPHVSSEERMALVRCVRFQLVKRSPAFGIEASKSLRLAEYIVRAEAWLKNIADGRQTDSPRLPVDILFCLGNSMSILQAAAFDKRKYSWQKLSTFKNFLARRQLLHALAHPHHKTQIVFLLNNYDTSCIQVYSFDVDNGGLSEVSTLQLSSSTLDHKLVHLGGESLAIFSFFVRRDGSDASLEIRRFDETRNEWTLAKRFVPTELPYLKSPCISRVKDGLYLTGGYIHEREEYSTQVRFFDETLLSFTSIGDMTGMNHSACEVGGKLVACGKGGNPIVEILEVTPTHCVVAGQALIPRHSIVNKLSKCDDVLVIFDELVKKASEVMDYSGTTATFTRLPKPPFSGSPCCFVPMPTRNLKNLLTSEEDIAIATREEGANQDISTLAFGFHAVCLFMRLLSS